MENERYEDEYEVIPVTPIRRLEHRIRRLEQSSTIPRLQSLITEIVQLIQTNQKLVDDVLRADMELKRELTKVTMKMDETMDVMKSFMNLAKAASEEEVGFSSEAMKPLAEQLQKMVEENKKIAETNQQIMEAINDLTKKIKRGTPVSHLITGYPKLKIKSIEK